MITELVRAYFTFLSGNVSKAVVQSYSSRRRHSLTKISKGLGKPGSSSSSFTLIINHPNCQHPCSFPVSLESDMYFSCRQSCCMRNGNTWLEDYLLAQGTEIYAGGRGGSLPASLSCLRFAVTHFAGDCRCSCLSQLALFGEILSSLLCCVLVCILPSQKQMPVMCGHFTFPHIPSTFQCLLLSTVLPFVRLLAYATYLYIYIPALQTHSLTPF